MGLKSPAKFCFLSETGIWGWMGESRERDTFYVRLLAAFLTSRFAPIGLLSVMMEMNLFKTRRPI